MIVTVWSRLVDLSIHITEVKVTEIDPWSRGVGCVGVPVEDNLTVHGWRVSGECLCSHARLGNKIVCEDKKLEVELCVLNAG